MGGHSENFWTAVVLIQQTWPGAGSGLAPAGPGGQEAEALWPPISWLTAAGRGWGPGAPLNAWKQPKFSLATWQPVCTPGRRRRPFGT